jgi:ABC-2 type transport system permease protein
MTAVALGEPRRSVVREFMAAVGTIMVKELRSRMRGRRAFIVLTVYLAILALITYGTYVIVAPTVRDQAIFGGAFGMGSANASAVIGQSIFTVLSVFQLILVCFIAPAFTAGQISLEREKQTLDLLISTPMRPGAIVVGKLLAALAFVVLMIVAAVPISAIVLMYGGASVDDLVRQQLVLLITALGLGTVGLFFSGLLKRTQAATVLTYITMLALTLGTAMVFIFWSVVVVRDATGFGASRQRAPEQLMYINPAVAMLDVVANTETGGFGGISSMLNELRGGPGAGNFNGVGETVCDGGACFDVDEFGRPLGAEVASVSGYWWPRFAITYAVLAALLTLASTRLVIPAGMRFAFRRRRTAVDSTADAEVHPDATPLEQAAVVEELPEPEP